MTFGRHRHFEELISASLGGELTDTERVELDAHLDGCAECRATLAAFADQRRIVSGLRHVGAPRDLGARVRAGIESGAHGDVPWWRRPAVAFTALGGGLAAVAGALLALTVLNATPEDPQVGVGTEPAIASATPVIASEPPLATPTASLVTEETPPPTPTQQPEPPEADPRPDVYLAFTGPFDNMLVTLRDGRTGDTIREVPIPAGAPVAAELSPNGQFLAFITRQGESGMNRYWVWHIGADALLGDASLPRLETSIPEWEITDLGTGTAGSEFLEHLAWSPNSRFLTYTIASADGPRASLFDAVSSGQEQQQWTETGSAHNAGWVAGGERGNELWALVSVAGPEPTTYVRAVGDMSTQPVLTLHGWPTDPSAGAMGVLPGVFQPLVSPDGARVIFWRGVMERVADEWVFVEGGAPYIAELVVTTQGVDLANERPLFSDVVIDRDAFVDAGVAWGADSDAYAVWAAEWAGIPQGSGEYPNINRVYFGHASDERELTEHHAIDAADLPEGATVVDVKVPTTRHLLVTAQLPIGGVMDAPRAQLLLVTRNTGNVPDVVQPFSGPGDTEWFGPGAYDAYWVVTVE